MELFTLVFLGDFYTAQSTEIFPEFLFGCLFIPLQPISLPHPLSLIICGCGGQELAQSCAYQETSGCSCPREQMPGPKASSCSLRIISVSPVPSDGLLSPLLPPLPEEVWALWWCSNWIYGDTCLSGWLPQVAIIFHFTLIQAIETKTFSLWI